VAGRLNTTAGRRQAAARGELTSEIVDLLRSAPELVVYGAEERMLERVRSADRELDRSRGATPWRAASGTASRFSSPG
jgi:ABC-type transport system involved in cytochrome bd biosynthesis, fused ATPase and permease components